MNRFEWDLQKNAENILKHGVNFRTAKLAFLDPFRRIKVDARHSQLEERYFCFGIVRGRVLTVRFTYRAGVIRILGAGYWRKGRAEYEKKEDF